MNSRLWTPISTAIAIAFGLIVLLGYFVDLDLLINLRMIFLRWFVILAAIALLVGIANLFSVHWRRVTSRQPGGFYSFLLIISLLATLVIVGFFGPTAGPSLWIFNYIQVPIESSLLALLAVVLAYAGARVLRRRTNLFTLIFVGTVLVVLLGSASLPGVVIPGLSELRAWIAEVPAVAGSRGIILGVALGTIATGLRVLMGVDRPYGG
jgi:hypothetical protein